MIFNACFLTITNHLVIMWHRGERPMRCKAKWQCCGGKIASARHITSFPGR